MVEVRRVPLALIGAAVASTAASAQPSSTLSPAGDDAAMIANLFWWMAAVSAVVWLAAVAILLHCLRAQRRSTRETTNRRLVAGGGVIIPTVLLGVLLGGALPRVSPLVDGPPPDDALAVHVTGEQWWWRVRYEDAHGRLTDLANEIRVPLGRRTHVTLTSDDVIHAFWIPSLAGKVDMLPGRTTHLTLEPSRAGVFRGVCAEYCGISHARMSFDVLVVEGPDFDAWLEAQTEPAMAPATADGARGARVFRESGCGACHAVRGTDADGTAGPDLSHVASRRRIAAATLADERDALEGWLRHPDRVKPGVLMPGFAALGDARIGALSAYLRELR